AWTLLFWRGVYGGLFIAAVMIWFERRDAIAAIRAIGRSGLVIAACSTFATICFINALQRTSVADVMVINATTPFFAAAIAWLWTGERERTATLVASVAALFGVILTFDGALSGGRLFGNLLALVMTILISLMMVIIRKRRGTVGLRGGISRRTGRDPARRARGKLDLPRAVRRGAVRPRLAAAHARHAPDLGDALGAGRIARDAARAAVGLARVRGNPLADDLRRWRRCHGRRCRRHADRGAAERAS